MPLKTLFLNPPSFENFDGGAGSRWPATREIESFWYPVWLAYPAGMLEGSRLWMRRRITFPRRRRSKLPRTTSSWCYSLDARISRGHPDWRAIKAANPKIKIAFVGPHVRFCRKNRLRDCPEIDFICRKEFDYAVLISPRASRWQRLPGFFFEGWQNRPQS